MSLRITTKNGSINGHFLMDGITRRRKMERWMVSPRIMAEWILVAKYGFWRFPSIIEQVCTPLNSKIFKRQKLKITVENHKYLHSCSYYPAFRCLTSLQG
jgi:hypothetical protein